MGKTISEWEKIVKEYSLNDLREFYKAFDRLEVFVEFKEEYDWTGLDVIKNIIKHELKIKEKMR